jgi:hypothetical protein
MIKSRRMKWAGHVALMGTKRNAYRMLVGKPEGKNPLGKPRHSLVDSIEVDLREIEWYGMDWINLAQDRDQWRVLVNTVMNPRVPYNVGKYLSSRATGGFSRRAQLQGVIWNHCNIDGRCNSADMAWTCKASVLGRILFHTWGLLLRTKDFRNLVSK